MNHLILPLEVGGTRDRTVGQNVSKVGENLDSISRYCQAYPLYALRVAIPRPA
jgi:hypothetical protein